MAFDTFIKFDGSKVKGESTADGHKDEIEIYSFSWGASNPTTVSSGSGGLAGGKVSISSFNFMKKTELSSPMLFAACCGGQHFPTCTVTMRKATGDAQQAFLVYTFSDVMVESIQWSGSSGGDDAPTESVSVAFAKCKIDYSKQDEESGALKPAGSAGWDLTTVKKV